MSQIDWASLARMERLVAKAMHGQGWLTPGQVRRLAGLGPEAEVKAAMRRLRAKPVPLHIESRKMATGWQYRLVEVVPPVPEWLGLPLFAEVGQ